MLNLWFGSTTSIREINCFAVSLTPLHSLLAKLNLASMIWRIRPLAGRWAGEDVILDSLLASTALAESAGRPANFHLGEGASALSRLQWMGSFLYLKMSCYNASPEEWRKTLLYASSHGSSGRGSQISSREGHGAGSFSRLYAYY